MPQDAIAAGLRFGAQFDRAVVEVTQCGVTWSDVVLELLVLIGLAVVVVGAVAITTYKAKQRQV